MQIKTESASLDADTVSDLKFTAFCLRFVQMKQEKPGDTVYCGDNISGTFFCISFAVFTF
jgi:hypothetical protein